MRTGTAERRLSVQGMVVAAAVACVGCGPGSSSGADLGNARQALSAAEVWSAQSDVAEDGFGSAVAFADVDADGFDDLLVGAPYFRDGEPREGAALLYHGSAGGLGAAPGWLYQGDLPEASCGRSVASAGDVDGDGYEDVLVSSASCNVAPGRVDLFLGGAAGLGLQPAWSSGAYPADCFGQATVAAAGDLNGDGHDDFAIGAPFCDNGLGFEGAVFVHLGSSGDPLAAPDHTVQVDYAGVVFGAALAAGDVNGDGHDDLVVGAPWIPGSDLQPGSVHLYLGEPCGLATTVAWTATAPMDGAAFGSSLAVGDVNADGIADIIVGAPDTGVGGAAFLYLGAAAGPSSTADWTLITAAPDAGLGAGLAAADVDGDGHTDVLVGASGVGAATPHVTGEAFLFAGGPRGLGAAPAWSVSAVAPGTGFGAVLAAGDADGDGRADLAVGETRWYDGVSNEGRVRVYGGACDDTDADGVCDFADNCPATSDPDQADSDDDGAGDLCDPCPRDPDDDADGDGVCGDADVCPLDPLDDVDGDGVCGEVDSCPETLNPDQADGDLDGLGDACDACPRDAGNDADGDGLCLEEDNCPVHRNPDQADRDGDGIGDPCDRDEGLFACSGAAGPAGVLAWVLVGAAFVSLRRRRPGAGVLR